MGSLPHTTFFNFSVFSATSAVDFSYFSHSIAAKRFNRGGLRERGEKRSSVFLTAEYAKSAKEEKSENLTVPILKALPLLPGFLLDFSATSASSVVDCSDFSRSIAAK